MLFWYFLNHYPRYLKQRKVWVRIRFVHETDKAILIYYDNEKVWIPKSRIYKIRLRKGVFEVYITESAIK